MVLFITKINTTGTNFSSPVFLLASTLSKSILLPAATSIPLPFLALQDNKIRFLNVLISVFCLVLRQSFFRILSCFCSQGINNFYNARGHYGEISTRQQPITARDFTGSNLRHIIIQLNETKAFISFPFDYRALTFLGFEKIYIPTLEIYFAISFI